MHAAVTPPPLYPPPFVVFSHPGTYSPPFSPNFKDRAVQRDGAAKRGPQLQDTLLPVTSSTSASKRAVPFSFFAGGWSPALFASGTHLALTYNPPPPLARAFIKNSITPRRAIGVWGGVSCPYLWALSLWSRSITYE